MTNLPPSPVVELIGRSNRLGSNRSNTNFGGGNTSAKGAATDPVSLNDVDVMWVKGSGGDLGTLTADGLSALRLDRLRALERRDVSVENDDELHQLLDHCAFGPPGAAPSIDTSMHGLLPYAHVDHLHPDSVMGGHGLTTWAESSDDCEFTSLEVIRRAAEFIDRHGKPEPLGPLRPGFEPLDPDDRRRRARRFAPVIRGLAGTDRHPVGRWLDDDVVVDFIGREATPRLTPLGTSCPDHFIRTKVRPLLLDLPTDASFDHQVARLRQLHEEYRAEYRRYYERHADGDTPPMRGADPAIFLIPGVGMFSFGADAQTARVAGEFYLNAINVIRGAEALSTYSPVSESEKFRIEYWMLEELKLRRRPAPRPLTGRVAVVTGAGTERGRAIAVRCADAGAVVVVVDIDETAASNVAIEIGSPDTSVAVAADITDEAGVDAAIDSAVLQFCGIDIIVDATATSSDMLSSLGADPMIAQGTGGAFVYIEPASGIARLATENRQLGIRVNGLDIVGEVAPNDIATAAIALVDQSLSKTTGQTVRIEGDIGIGGIGANG